MKDINTVSTFSPVYSQNLAGYLMQQGFVLIALVPRENRKNMFLFINSPELHDAISHWKEMKP